MADQLRQNPFRPSQSFSAPGASSQDLPEPPKYSALRSQATRLPPAPRVYESSTNQRDLKTHNITSKESSSHSNYLKSHTGTNSGQSSSGTSSQQAGRSHNHPGTSGKPTHSPAVDALFSHPSISNPSYSQHAPRQPSVSSQHESRSSSIRTESSSSSRTSLPTRTTFRETTGLPTSSMPSEPSRFDKMWQEMEESSDRTMSQWKKDSEARRKEFFSDFDSRSEALNRGFANFRERPSTAPLAQSTAMLSSGRGQIESHSDSERSIQATYTVPHIPENIALTLRKIVDKHIEGATSNVHAALRFLKAALEDALDKLSLDIVSKQTAFDALRSSQRRLDMLSREYQNAHKNRLNDGDIPEFSGKVLQRVQPFIAAAKKITSDPGKAVTFKIDFTIASGDKTHKTQLT